MRIVAGDKANPAWLWVDQVFLDGKEIEHVVLLDTDKGYVDVLKSGRLGPGCVVETERRHGTVTFTWRAASTGETLQHGGPA